MKIASAMILFATFTSATAANDFMSPSSNYFNFWKYYTSSDCTSVPSALGISPAEITDEDCTGPYECAEKTGSTYLVTTCVSNMTSTLEELFGETRYLLEATITESEETEASYDADVYLADGNCHLAPIGCYKVQLNSNGSMTLFEYQERTKCIGDADYQHVALADQLNSGVMADQTTDDQGYVHQTYWYTNIKTASASTGTTTNTASTIRSFAGVAIGLAAMVLMC